MIKISIIGTGQQSAVIKKICKKIPQSRIDFFFSRKKKYVNGYKATHYLKNLLGSKVIFICTPPNGHLKMLKRLYKLKYNNYIICEKPLINSLNQIKEVEKFSSKFKRKLFVNFNFESSQLAKILSQIIKNKSNGNLKYAEFQISHGAAWYKTWKKQWRLRTKLGPIENTAIHYIYFLKKLFGDYKILLKNLSFSTKNMGKDTAETVLKYSNIYAFFRFSYSEPYHISFRLIFSNAKVLYDGKILNYYFKRETSYRSGKFIESKIKKSYKVDFYRDFNNSTKNNIKKILKTIKSKKYNSHYQLNFDLNVLKPFYKDID